MNKLKISSLLFLPLLFILLSCGGGGSGGDDSGGTAPPILTASFISDLTVLPSPGFVALQLNDTLSTSSEPLFDVVVYGLLEDDGINDNRVYGISFHLSFNDTILSYVDTIFTDALGAGINTETALNSGVLSVGMSKSGAVDGTEIPESGTVMMQIKFKALSSGTSTIYFMDSVAGSDCGTAGHSACHILSNADIGIGDDVSTGWYGGTVDII